jgi:hypothetical protein
MGKNNCWNCLLAQRVLGHAEMAGLLRELRRNPSLRAAVGMDPNKGEKAVPTKDAMSRFVKKLVGAKYRTKVEGLVGQLLGQVRQTLPDLGRHAAVDSTALRTWARGRGKPEESSDPEADWGHKTRRWTDKEGQRHEEVRTWFGYKLHLLVDTRHELPVAWKVTRASAADNGQVQGLLEGLKERHPGIRVETLAGDKAYDDGPLVQTLHAQWHMPHGTQQRKRRYNGRTACERVNSRLKVGLMLGDLKVRGKARIELGVAIALVVLLGMAKGHLQRKAKAWRSLTRLAQ